MLAGEAYCRYGTVVFYIFYEVINDFYDHHLWYLQSFIWLILLNSAILKSFCKDFLKFQNRCIFRFLHCKLVQTNAQ